MKNTILIIFVLLYVSSFAQEEEIKYKINGFADTYHAVRSESPNDFMSSRSRLRTEFSVNKGNSSMFTSLNSIYNSILEDQTKIELREAFFQYNGKKVEFKAGRQIIIWGVSDGLRVTDLVSPMDMTEFLARDYDDVRIPVNAAKLKYITEKLSAEIIFIPVSSFYILPTDSLNPWTVFPAQNGLVNNLSINNVPDKNIENSELGGRLSFYLSGIDFSFSGLHTWNKMPVFEYGFSKTMDTIHVHSVHKRMDMLGMDISFPVRQFVIRGEFAEYFNEIQSKNTDTSINDQILRNTANYMLGLDWYPGHEWTVSIQFSNKYIPNHNNNLANEENNFLSTLNISKKIFRSTLNLSSFAYYDITNESLFNRLSADYSLSDQIHLMLGYDLFNGDQGMFGFYKNNSEYWFKAKYSF